MKKRYTVGLDLGTTGISGLLWDAEQNKAVWTKSLPNKAALPPEFPGDARQDPEEIFATAETLLQEAAARVPESEWGGIGLTGQMHGIVLLDVGGKPVSPLYTWQDQRGARTAEKLSRLCKGSFAPGYGLATLGFLLETGEMPPQATKIATVMDALALRLTGENTPVLDPTNAQSLGGWIGSRGDFDREGLARAGIDVRWLPEISGHGKDAPVGRWRNIPVFRSIGDNQASFRGATASLMGKKALLINIGTGSQVSVLTSREILTPHSESRAYPGGAHLTVGAPLCGGRAYALLEKLLRGAYGGTGRDYARLDKLAEEAWEELRHKKTTPLIMETTFAGTRAEPGKTGSIRGITIDNFTPGHLALACMKGVANELAAIYWEAEEHLSPEEKPEIAVFSGNGLRASAIWRQVTREIFSLPAVMASNPEEAATGAALFARDWAELQ